MLGEARTRLEIKEDSSWLDNLGFTGNPFYLEPVPAEGKAITKGFVDRGRERNSAEDFIQLRAGKLLILGRVGEGKSSLLNLLEYEATKKKKLILRIDLQRLQTKELFFEALLREMQRSADSIPLKQKEDLNRKLEDLAITRKTGKKTYKSVASVEGKLGALIAHIKGRIGAEEEEAERVEYYVPPRIRKLQGIAEQVLSVVFDSVSTIVLCDNLEKLTNPELKSFITEVASLLPSNISMVATANVTELDPNTLQKCYDNFDVPLLMDKVDTAPKLREFIEARMTSYSKTRKPPIFFDEGAVEMLLERTGGNLRESFRYCYFAIQKFKKDINKKMMLEAIRDCDAPRFEVLSETDNKLLEFLASQEDRATIKEVFEAFREEGLEKDALRKRLDNLATLGLVRKNLVKSGRTYKANYRLPQTLKQVLHAPSVS